MSDPMLSLKVEVDAKPAEKGLKQVDEALAKTAKNAKASGSKIDEAFKAATGKVQESLGPMGKLLGPTAIGVGAVGLALGAMAAAASKAFSAVKEAAGEVKNLGTSSGFTATQLQTLTARAKAADDAFVRLKVSSGIFFGGLVEALTPAVNTLADLTAFATTGYNSIFLGIGDPSAGAFEAGMGYRPTRNAVLDKEAALAKRKAELKKQQDDQQRNQDAANAKARAAREARNRRIDELGRDTMSQYNSGIEYARSEENRIAGLRNDYAEIIRNYHAQRKADNIERIARVTNATERSFFDRIGGAGLLGAAGSGIGGVASAAISGGNVGQSVVAGLGGVATTAISSALGPVFGPLAGSILGGVIDGLVGAFGESEAEKARKEAFAKTKARWAQNNRDAAWKRRNLLPQFEDLGKPNWGGATVVNVSFNGPVGGSARRIARELGDVMRAGGNG